MKNGNGFLSLRCALSLAAVFACMLNLYDPVPHISGQSGLFLPVALMEHFVPSVTHEWITEDQHGSGWLYHSWFPSYEGR